MLESTALLLSPWQGAPSHLSRPILDAATLTLLGQARSSSSGSAWQRWLGNTDLEVCETADLALLCHVHQHWGMIPRWSVRDADGQLVGRLEGRILRDAFGRTVAVRRVAAGETGERFLSPQGVELGTLEQRSDGLLLTFGIWLEGEPFARMLLLAAAATGDWQPRAG
jgi:hypothetical protein